jgi:adenosylcobinamide-GDP ribazoletransferase
MIAQWRLFLLALRYFTRIPVPASVVFGNRTDRTRDGQFDSAARFLPAVGAVVGVLAGAIYWLAAQVWPTSIAVVLSMLAAALVTGGIHEAGLADVCMALGLAPRRGTAGELPDLARFPHFGVLGLMFLLLVRYNVLMGLSSANLSFPLPPDCALGLIMIAAHAASRALVVSVIATAPAPTSAVRGRAPVFRLSTGELLFALATGFAPAILIGIPGLTGLAAAIIMRMLFVAYVRLRLGDHPGDYFGATQQLTEVSFYLGALGAWTYS